MNTVSFNRQGGGLAKRLPGEDHISGLVVYGQPNVDKTGNSVCKKSKLDFIRVTSSFCFYIHRIKIGRAHV